MTKFNPENKEVLTAQEEVEPAMHITDKDDAVQYKAAYIEYMQKLIDKEPWKNHTVTAESIVNSNLGYCAGYYDAETRKRVNSLFGVNHPLMSNNNKIVGQV